MRSVSGPVPMDITYAFDDAGPGTRASIRVGTKPAAPSVSPGRASGR